MAKESKEACGQRGLIQHTGKGNLLGANERFNDCSKTPLTGGNGRNPLKAETAEGHIYVNMMAQSTSTLQLGLHGGGNKA